LGKISFAANATQTNRKFFGKFYERGMMKMAKKKKAKKKTKKTKAY